MIRLTSAAQARDLACRIPQLAVTRMEQFEGDDGCYDPGIHGHIVVIEGPGDNLSDIPEIGEAGIFGVIDRDAPGYEYVEVVIEDGRRIFEMVIAIDADRTVAIIIPDIPDLDPRLRQTLEAETGLEDTA